MALSIVQSPQADEDLTKIWVFVAHDNEPAADRLLDTILDKATMLSRFPASGRQRPELTLGLRSYPVGSYIIFYRYDNDVLRLVRVLNASIDISEIDFN